MSEGEGQFVFADEKLPKRGALMTSQPPWRILVVDDDADVHEATRFALKGIPILGRPVEFLHAHSGAEALAVLRREQDIAVLLLDVVMETPDAGLRIVSAIRDELQLTNLRIVLRTGQPGQAPEMDAISRYDINDYKTKNELTRNKLFTTVTAALRSYEQLRRLDASRRGLEKVIAASNDVMTRPGLRSFAEGIILQIASLIGVPPEGLVCASTPQQPPQNGDVAEVEIIAAAGRFSGLTDKPFDTIDEPRITTALRQSLSERRNLVEAHSVALFFETQDQHAYAVFVDSNEPIHELDQSLLHMFCTNMSLCAQNIQLVSALRDQAYFDRLVSLPNRSAMLRELDRAIDSAGRNEQALALVDIDQFSAVNDLLGHPYGDQLLSAIAQRLSKEFPGCFVARVSGDVFGLLGRREHLTPDAIGRLFSTPFNIDQVDHPLTVSTGIVHLRDVQGSGSDGIQNAYIALKRAKTTGLGHHAYYSESIANETHDRNRMRIALHRALAKGDQLYPVFQPQLDLLSGRVVGLEALTRWRGDNGAHVSPDRFIPVAEQTALILPIGEWILRRSIDVLESLHQHGHTGLRMSVNVSTVQLRQPNFLSILDHALDGSSIRPECLELEITESVAALGINQVRTLLEAIRARGVSIAIDDFGTGFSSLSYLHRLPANRLKIDRSFIHTLEHAQSGRIAEMIVPLGHQLGMKVLAEGVETASQRDRLRALGCDEMQGYLLARPMIADDLAAWLDAYRPNAD
ncbi:bifunctional diguanylate cyclase/phosphodiesterase [Denitromonas ohlonensis]|uniref:EAL domain-containing protein n=2 Tax=Denitromonas TaxID=139331 RepID=A0A558CAG1_9RHOO|nr:EAL domain-containing protein [Denitromonas ohlonensis]TVT45765.1 MAG: EAL domain-containing protein [Denitromonas halophila]TVO63129.1 EAL domain-containing protein [Denitromonas ohlonensis]TVO71652.1 EAL domain-containing protein [Denitromonas ohlonensis]TVT71898.1 MAG: EAL domain-containing protein [Denitromonas halophila]TVT77050.1 MAG: EAL domain-containing protein [Denitromonas halophila]